MPSSLFGTTQQSSPVAPVSENSIQQAQRLMAAMAPGQSPEQMLQSLISQNPQYNNIASLLNASNGDIRSLVINLAKQQGVDLNALYERYKAL